MDDELCPNCKIPLIDDGWFTDEEETTHYRHCHKCNYSFSRVTKSIGATLE
jgi:hypothetical protein